MRKLPLIILIVILLVALLVVLPFSPHILHALESRLHSAASSNATVVSTLHSTTGSTPQKASSVGALISRNVPVFASSEAYPATNANDNSYDTTWRSNGAAWLAYDLSGVPANKRSKVLVVWYNETGNYDHTVIGDAAYNLPESYTIDVNAAVGGGQPPTTGWKTLVTVHGNHYHSRQAVITMAGNNWLRLNITAIDGSYENYDASINMDVYDASSALTDDWIFYGDLITAGAMDHDTLNGTAAFAQLVNAHLPNDYPVQESGGIGYLTSSDAVKNLNTWLGLFPGKYVGLSYGTNDALSCVNPETFYNNYVTLVQDVLHAGKTPLIPFIPWGRNTNIQRCAPALNAQITKLYTAFPQIIHGPNLWSFFQSHQNLISSDNIHPTDAGFDAYRQQWVNTLLTEVYKS